QTECVHQQVTLAAAQFLGPIVAARTTLLTRPNGLTIQNGTAGLALSPRRLAYQFPHGAMDFFPQTLAAPQPEVMVNRTPRRQVVRKQFPSAAAADGVTDAIDDLASRVFGRTAARLGGWDEQLQILPLSIGEITVLRLAGSHLASVAKTSFSNALSDPAGHPIDLGNWDRGPVVGNDRSPRLARADWRASRGRSRRRSRVGSARTMRAECNASASRSRTGRLAARGWKRLCIGTTLPNKGA